MKASTLSPLYTTRTSHSLTHLTPSLFSSELSPRLSSPHQPRQAAAGAGIVIVRIRRHRDGGECDGEFGAGSAENNGGIFAWH